MTALRATYRLQLRAGVTLETARTLVPYLHRLGVSHLYLSPVLCARPGSEHGYDVVDPTRLDPALGGEAAWRALLGELRRCGMGVVLDIVPNHMATGSANPFWEDVLTHGARSEYARWFDIDWGPARRRRVFLPVLGDRLHRVLARGELGLVVDRGRIRVRYFEQEFPLDPRTIPLVLRGTEGASDPVQPGDGDQGTPGGLREILDALGALPSWAGPPSPQRRSSAQAPLDRLRALYEDSPDARRAAERAAQGFGRGPSGPDRWRRLLRRQPYRLAYWRRAAGELNYRRFFTISDLIAVRQEEPAVFAATHEWVLRAVAAGEVDALRVDHVDGLLDPTAYLARIQTAVGGEPDAPYPVVVEKILARDEELPDAWPVAGTTGYEFLTQVDELLLHPHGVRELDAFYRRLTGRDTGFGNAARRGKRRILRRHLTADVRRLGRWLSRLAPDGARPSPPVAQLVEAIVETIARFDRYRAYVRDYAPWYPDDDREALERALTAARGAARAAAEPVDWLRDALLLTERWRGRTEGAAERLAFARRFQQLCVPAAAKGVEDTALYVHVPLVARNEVGAEPDAPLDDATGRFHRASRIRAQRWPGTLLCASTHDAKRSADVRARLAVLSEMPERWAAHVRRWRRWNCEHRVRVGRRAVPGPNSEYLLYQTLVGIWPPCGPRPALPDEAELATLGQRVRTYMVKAAREAKVFTTWVRPDTAYEMALTRFCDRLLDPVAGRAFQEDVARLVADITRPGMWNALARTVVQHTAPGVPDLYQGDELWDWSLVDPDNRRPVDFGRRQTCLADLEGRAARSDASLLRELTTRPEDGRIKQYVIWRALAARARLPELFRAGGYETLEPVGAAAGHLVAFARRDAERAAVTVVPRLTTALSPAGGEAPLGAVWSDTVVSLPDGLRATRWQDVLTGREIAAVHAANGPALPVADVLAVFPVALLVATGERARGGSGPQ